MKNYILVVLLVLMLVLSATDMVIEKNDGSMMSVPVDQIDNITFAQYEEAVVAGITLQWRTAGDYLFVNLMAPTTGWVAVGFDPVNAMQDADIIIGYVDSSGEVYIRDDYGTSPGSHASDTSLGGADHVMDHYGMDDGEMTMLHFKIPLNSGDEYDKMLVPGNTYEVILAYGSADNFTAFHTMATSTEIEL
jgi:hypothetical protein